MKIFHLLLILFLIIFGAINTLMLSLQNKQEKKYFHPFMQTVLVTFAQSLSVVPYLIYRCFREKRNYLEMSGFMKMECPWYMPLIPGLLDIISSVLVYVALTFSSASVWQISRGGQLVITAIFSTIILKKKFTKSATLGCLLAFLGITIVQIFEITLPDDSNKNKDDHLTTGEQIVGIVFLLVSLFFHTGTLISQKMIFNKYNINPLKMVFIEGIFGFITMGILITILSFVGCPSIVSIQKKCQMNLYHGKQHLDSAAVFYQQISKNMMLLIFNIGLIVSMSIAVPIAVTISKVINPVSRALADVCRTVLIWGCGLFLTLQLGGDKYTLQNTRLLTNLLKIIGFVMLILGTMIYHDIIRIWKSNEELERSSLLGLGDDNQNRYDKRSVLSEEDGKKQKEYLM